MSFIPVDEAAAKISLAGTTLLLPAVSVGNVGQFAVDALLCTLKPAKLGYFHDPRNVVAVVGNDALATKSSQNDGNIGTSVEVFYCRSRNLVLLQQRAPAILDRNQKYASNLLEWVQQAQFSRVICLTSTHAFKRQDHLLPGGSRNCFFVAGPNKDKNEKECLSLGWRVLTKEDDAYAEDDLNIADYSTKKPLTRSVVGQEAISGEYVDADEGKERGQEIRRIVEEREMKIVVAGQGITRSLVKECIKRDVDILGVVMLAFEGNNANDGVELAKFVEVLIPDTEMQQGAENKETKWKTPCCWKVAFN